MCGIIANIQHDQLIPQEQFQQQLDSIRHRGPDDQGVWFSPNGHVGLGTRRLAIQDLSPAGHMPMGDPSGQVWITYNGEIYNFQPLRADLTERGYAFRSGSDTEVVLAAYLEWGTDCLDFLNGMYAFVIYDSRDIPQSPHLAGPGIFAARDRAGEKPFYYWPHADGIYCASELKSLIANPYFPRRLDTAAFNFYLAYGYFPCILCILDEVKKLPAAHALTYVFETKALKTWRYWQPPTNMPVETADPDTLVNELESLLEDSVRARLVADVPVGILLSGGLDSSLITAMAARTSSTPVKTFTISFPGHGHYDEGPFARQVADYFATDHCELIAEPATIDLLPEMAHYFDEPLGDSSLIPTYLVSRLTREHVTVALGGDGGDELFGGYRRYSNALNKQRLLTRVPQPVRALTARIASE
ncbi:MAG: asparagine synthase (glutamine-hydrolyzing) [Chloroflexota bacterium]